MMDIYWLPDDIRKKFEEDTDWHDSLDIETDYIYVQENGILVEQLQTDLFHVGDTDYGKKEFQPIKTYVCSHCGGNQFHVGEGRELNTFIKCVNCEWEMVIHDG